MTRSRALMHPNAKPHPNDWLRRTPVPCSICGQPILYHVGGWYHTATGQVMCNLGRCQERCHPKKYET